MSVSISGTTFRQIGTDANLQGFLTANTAAFTTLTVTGASGNVTSITINAVEILGATVNYTTSAANTAALIAAQINAFSTTWKAFVASGAVVTIQAVTGGAGNNGLVLVKSGTLTTTGGANTAGGGATGATSSGSGTANTEGAYYAYNLGASNNVQVYGSLTLNPQFECMIFGATVSTGSPRIDIKSGGSLTIGNRVLADGAYNYSDGLAIHDPTKASSSNEAQACVRCDVGGTINWYGGVIQARANLAFISGLTQAIIWSRNCVLKALGLSSGDVEPLQFRQRSSLTEIYGITVDSCDIVHIENAAVLQGITPTGANEANGLSSSTPSDVWIAVSDYDPAGGAVRDFAFWARKWFRVVNCATGSAVDALGHNVAANTSNAGLIEFRAEVTMNVRNVAGSGIGGRVFCRDTNNGNRLAATVFNNNPSYTADRTYESALTAGAATFDADGGVLVAARYQNTAGASVAGSASILADFRSLSNSNADDFRFALASYGYEPATTTAALKGAGGVTVSYVMLTDTGVTASAATAATYTDRFSFDGSGNITVTANATLDELYDYAQSWLQASGANMESAGLGSKLIGFSGDGLTTAKNITINVGATLSSGTKFKAITTTGTLTITGSMGVRSYTSPAGTFVQLGATSLTTGSRYQFYNVTDASEISNGIAGGTSVSQYVQYTTDKTIRLRLAYQSGASAKLEWLGTGILSSSGLSFLAAQVDDLVYGANAIDGSTVTEFTADFPSVEIDVSDPDNITTVQRLYAWYVAQLMTADGIRNFFGAITGEDLVNYRINTAVVDMLVDNTAASPVIIAAARLYRDDGSTVIAAASGSIQMDPDKAYLAQAPLLDVAVSTRLASASYTAPNNAGIAAIDARLPATPASSAEVTAVGTTVDAAVDLLESDKVFAPGGTPGSGTLNFYLRGTLVPLVPPKNVTGTSQTQAASLVE